MTTDDLRRVLDATPWLSAFGAICPRLLKAYKLDFAEDRRAITVDHFDLSCEWLRLCHRRQTFNDDHTSYNLKHHVEQWAYPAYVTNGAFIAAAIYLGFEIGRIKDSPNVLLNISSRFPKNPRGSTEQETAAAGRS